MPTDRRHALARGSAALITAAAVVALTGAYLCVSGVRDGDVLRAVVAAVQTAAGAYLVLWQVGGRRRRDVPTDDRL